MSTMTRDQESAAALIRQAAPGFPLAIRGYAGTGKSWLAGNVVPEVFTGRRLVYAAPTNKAARGVLRAKLRKAGRNPQLFPSGKMRVTEGFTADVSIGTVFALMNIPHTELLCKVTREPCEDGDLCDTHEKEAALPGNPAGITGPCRIIESELQAIPRHGPLRGAEVIIIDEASMLRQEEYERLAAECAEHGIILLLFGDPGQLPPVGEPFSYALSGPGITMESITRQAADSPVIHLSRLARSGQYLQPGSWSETVHVLGPEPPPGMIASAALYFARGAAGDGNMIICPRHDGHGPGGRTWHNLTARQQLGFAGKWPQPGDAVVSMANDYYLWRAHNGSRGQVLEAGRPFDHDGEQVIELTVEFSEHRDPRRFLALAAQFGFPGNGSPGQRKIPPTVRLRPALRRELEQGSVRILDLSRAERKMLQDGKEPLLRLDYGYALTAWKAQGDEAPGVMVTGAYGRLPHVDRRAYLYTAITRATSELCVC